MPKGTRIEPGIYELSPGVYRLRVRVRGRDYEATHDGSLESARGAREQLRRERAAGRSPSKRGSPPKLRAYVSRWLKRRKVEDVQASTLKTYRADLARACALLGDLDMDAITRADVLDLRDALAAEYKPKTVNNTLRQLGQLFRDARIEYDLRGVLPTEGAKPLKAPSKYTEDNPGTLTGEELRRLLTAAEEHDPGWVALLTLLALTGARIGEALALRVEDIDEERGLVWIRRSQDGEGRITEPKTKAKRSAPLSPVLRDVLRSHREEMLRAQNRSYSQGWLFGSGRKRKRFPFGGPYTQKAPAAALKRALKAAGLDGRITLHGLRRTLNTLLVEASVDPIVTRSITGHVTEEMREHYAHVRPATKASALGRVLALVKG